MCHIQEQNKIVFVNGGYFQNLELHIIADHKQWNIPRSSLKNKNNFVLLFCGEFPIFIMRYKGVFTFLNAVVTGQVGGVILYNSYNFGTQ